MQNAPMKAPNEATVL